MIFTVINIGTGYLNRPNWLLAGYSVYHRVPSQGFQAGFPAHNVYDRPANSAPCGTPTMHVYDRPANSALAAARRRDGVCRTPTMSMTGPCKSWHQQRCVHACRPARPGGTLWQISDRTGYIGGVQYCNRVCVWKFLVRYIVTGCIFCVPSGLWQGQILNPQRHPPTHLRGECPPPPEWSPTIAHQDHNP